MQRKAALREERITEIYQEKEREEMKKELLKGIEAKETGLAK